MSKSEVVTSLSPDEAVARLVPLLTSGGAKVHSATSAAITGDVSTKQHASCLITLLLMCLMILPGLLYMILAGKTLVEPFSISIIPEPAGTRLVAAGQGRGEKAAQAAIGKMPAAA